VVPVKEGAGTDLRVAHMLRVMSYIETAILSMWMASQRAQSAFGMAEASVRDRGPGGADEELLEKLRGLIAEAWEHYAAEDFPAAMARMRVAQDLAALRIIEISVRESG
jgi:hypothetical protein